MSDLDEVILPYEFIKDVLWWKEFTPLFNGSAGMFVDVSPYPDYWLRFGCMSVWLWGFVTG